MENTLNSLNNIPFQDFSDINTLVFFLIFLIILQTLVIIYMLYYSHRFLRGHVDSQKKLFENFRNTVTQTRTLLSNVRKNSLSLFKDANKDSLSIIESSIGVQEDLKRELLKKADEVKAKYSNLLREQSKELSTNLEENAKNIFDQEATSIKKMHAENLGELLKEVKYVVEDVHKHLIDSHEVISTRVDSEYKKIDEYLSSYKESKVRDLDKNFERVVGEMVASYLKRSLDIPTHEEIIREIIKNRLTTLQKM